MNMFKHTPRSLRSALLVVMGMAMAACSENPTAPVTAPAQTQIRADATTTLLPMVQWNTARANAASSTQYVGILGGTVSAGGVTLIVPPLALSQRTAITLTVPAGQYVMAELQPHGLTFRVDPLLLFPVLGTNAGVLGVTNLIGVYSKSDPVGGLIPVDETYSMDLLGTVLGFHIHHFSDYAPADNRKGLILMGG
jgi:hypothetical protein